jgi:hypothetical protein
MIFQKAHNGGRTKSPAMKTRKTHTTNAAKFATIRTPETAAPATAATATAAARGASDDAFFAEATDIAAEARNQALEVITRLLIWIAEAGDTQGRGLRATIMLHCVRPDLIGGVTLEQIGDAAGISKQAAHKLAREFRLDTGLEP